MLYCGVDLHKRISYITVMDEQGQLLKQTKLDNTELKNFFNSLDDSAQVAVESTNNWYYFYELIEEVVNDISLAHPYKTKAIAQAKIKTDKIDSTILAHLLRTDLLPKSYIPPKEIRDLREILRYRASLVRLRTQIKNKIHAILLKNGTSQQFSDLFGKQGIQFLKELPLRDTYRLALNGYLKALENLSLLIKEVSNIINDLAQDSPDVQLLMTIPGIGAYSAMLIASEVGDIARFYSSKHFSSYCGLSPSTSASADRIFHGSIGHTGSKYLRWILVEAAQKPHLYKGPLHEFYQRIKHKKGQSKATVALARKLSVVVYFILKNKINFEYFYNHYRSGQPVNYLVSK